MRIGLVCYPGLGGSGIVASELAHWLAERGHQVWLFATERPFRLPSVTSVRFVEVDVPHYPVFPTPLYDLALAGSLESALRREGLEIIHTHYAIPHAVSAWLASEGRVALVHTLHGSDVTILGLDPAYRSLTARALKRAQGLSAVSVDLARRAEFVFGVRPQVIPNAVDPERFYPRPEARGRYARPNEALLVHASNFRPVKRVPDLIRIFAHLRRKLPARLLLLGQGSELPEVVRLIRELGLEASVEILPPTPHPEEVLGAADLFLLTSEEESFGQAALEALASGVPVVATDVGGVRELVTPEVGRLVELGDFEGFAETAVELLRSPDFEKMRQRARSYAQTHFPPERITRAYETLYEEALARWRSTSGQTEA